MHTTVRSLAYGEYIGRAHRQHTVCGAVLAETVYGPYAMLPPHCHAAPTIFLIVQGQFDERANGRVVAYPAGTFAYHPGAEVHSGQFGSRAGRGFHVELTREIEATHGISLDRRRLGAHAEPLVSALLRELRAELPREDDARPLALGGIVLQLVAAVIRADASDAPAALEDRAVRRAQEILADTSGRLPDWSAIANASGLPEAELLRAFQRTLRCTPAAYVRRLRVDAAARELATGDAPLSRIALAAGYYDQAHFSRSFKARFGMTPSAYRKVTRG